MSPPDEPERPVICVVRGNPTPEELAAIVLVLVAGPPAPAAQRHHPTGGQWGAYWRSLRNPIAPGPGAWRQSGRSG